MINFREWRFWLDLTGKSRHKKLKHYKVKCQEKLNSYNALCLFYKCKAFSRNYLYNLARYMGMLMQLNWGHQILKVNIKNFLNMASFSKHLSLSLKYVYERRTSRVRRVNESFVLTL